MEKLRQGLKFISVQSLKYRSLVREERKGGGIDYLQSNPSCYSLTETMKDEPKLNTLSCPVLYVCAREL